MQVCRAAISARTISSCLEILGAKGWNSNILKKYPVHHFLPKLTAPMCLQHPFCCDNKFPCIYWKNFLSLWVTSNTHSLNLFLSFIFLSIPRFQVYIPRPQTTLFDYEFLINILLVVVSTLTIWCYTLI